ncbi:MAG: hypothetical protein OEU32_19970, partial [Acidimicrobiia bacterium]|nr:hypothetical protein [Acidimicrobiia bacterium]
GSFPSRAHDAAMAAAKGHNARGTHHLTEPTRSPVLNDRLVRMIIVACIAAAAVLAFIAFFVADRDSGDDVTVTDNPAIEALDPRRGTEVLQQVDISIDLAAGYEGTIVRVNDIEIPQTEVAFDATRNIVRYSPGTGRALEALLPEQNCVTAEYWRSAEGPARAQTITWCFTAA